MVSAIHMLLHRGFLASEVTQFAGLERDLWIPLIL